MVAQMDKEGFAPAPTPHVRSNAQSVGISLENIAIPTANSHRQGNLHNPKNNKKKNRPVVCFLLTLTSPFKNQELGFIHAVLVTIFYIIALSQPDYHHCRYQPPLPRARRIAADLYAGLLSELPSTRFWI
jgi:hypothetical protein